MDLFNMDKEFVQMDDLDDKLEDFIEHDLFTPSPGSESVLSENSLEFSLDNGMDDNWLDSLFGNHPVLNDRMISDALHTNPHVQSEHSYSILNNEKALDMTVKKEVTDSDIIGTTVNPNSMVLTSAIKQEPSYNPTSLQSSSNIVSNTTVISSGDIDVLDDEPSLNYSRLSSQIYSSQSTADQIHSASANKNTLTTTLSSINMGGYVKQELMDTSSAIERNTCITSSSNSHQHPTMVTVTRTMNPQTLLKPTIILATQQQPNTYSSSHQSRQTGHLTGLTSSGSHISRQQERLVLPKVNVKVEPAYSYSSAASTASSPERISYDQLSLPPTPPSSSNSDSDGCQSPERSQPSSPVMRGATSYHHTILHQKRHSSPSPPPCAPFFMNPIPTSGILILSEEEKRTLISEGYPIPNKLPLTKGEEKNLKKIRRKIKNKISAQESRRKKKDYLESLEKKVESYSQENGDLKKKMDSLENNNRSLMGQLQKLQSIVNKLRPQNASPTGTCLMVIVLCFAVFLGTWSPMTWSIGYSSINSTPGINSNNPLSPLEYDHRMNQIHGHLGEQNTEGGQMHMFKFNVNDASLSMTDRYGHSVDDLDASTFPSGYNDGSDIGGGIDIHKGSEMPVMGPDAKEATSDPYSTSKMKSRVLLSVRDEDDRNPQDASYQSSFCLKDYINNWLNTVQMFPSSDSREVENLNSYPGIPKVEILDVETEINQTGDGIPMKENGRIEKREITDQATMHPDIEVVTQRKMDTSA